MKKVFLSFCFLLSLILSLTCCVKVTQPTVPQATDANDLYHSTVAFVAEGSLGIPRTYCAGVWIGPRHILTARHCIDKDNKDLDLGTLVKFTTYRKYNVDFPDGGPTSFSFAVLVKEDFNSDLALLTSVDEVRHKYVSLGRTVKLGQKLAIVGHPSGVGFAYIQGTVSQVRHMNMHPLMRHNTKMIHLTSLIWSGNSGGGAFNAQGELVGIAAFMRRDIPGMAFFIHRDALADFLEGERY